MKKTHYLRRNKKNRAKIQFFFAFQWKLFDFVVHLSGISQSVNQKETVYGKMDFTPRRIC